MRRPALLLVASLILTVGLATPAGAAITPDGFTPTCADQDRPIGEIGRQAAERAIVCGLSQVRRHYDDPSMKANERVRRAAVATLKSGNFTISRIARALSATGYFRSGGRGFQRCSPMRRRVSTTPLDFVTFVVQREGFVIRPPHKNIGVAFSQNRIFMVVGR